jgi:hypothetical protein
MVLSAPSEEIKETFCRVQYWPVPVAVLSKARMVLAEIVGVRIPLEVFFCVLLSCVDRNLAVGLSSAKAVLPKCLKEFVVSEINSES